MLQVGNIHHLYLWQLNALIALLQFHESILARLGIMVALQRGCCRSQ